MELLHGLIVIVVSGAAVAALGLSLLISYFLVQAIWPTLVGLGGGYFIWLEFGRAPAFLFLLVCLFVQLWWRKQRNQEIYVPQKEITPLDSRSYQEKILLPDYFDL